jgi:hypothetical protein
MMTIERVVMGFNLFFFSSKLTFYNFWGAVIGSKIEFNYVVSLAV